jgi:hypothetical protein
MLQTQVEKKKKFILRSREFVAENCFVYEIMWKKYGTTIQVTDDNIIGRTRFARGKLMLLVFYGKSFYANES